VDDFDALGVGVGMALTQLAVYRLLSLVVGRITSVNNALQIRSIGLIAHKRASLGSFTFAIRFSYQSGTIAGNVMAVFVNETSYNG
jgi:hypothetical protein